MKDDWSKLDVDNPLEAVQDTVFFKLVEFVYLQATTSNEVSNLIPTAESIFGLQEIGQLANEPNFRFLIQSGYERINRVIEENNERLEESAMET